MIKKISIFLTVAVMAIVSIFLFGSREVFADSVDPVGEISSMQVSATSLGLPATLDYNFTRTGINTNSDFTVNGITYTVTDGQITAASAPENASEITTIGFLDSVGGKTIQQSVYTNMSFSGYTNVKNIVLERTFPAWFGTNMATGLSGAENMYVFASHAPMLEWKTNTSLKNVVFCQKLISVGDISWWGSNSNFKLDTYPEGCKFVTAETLKWVYGKLLDWYKVNPNYSSEIDTNIYLVPDTYFSNTLNVSLTGFQAEEYGGAVWVKTKNSSAQTGYSIAYIDPSVTKLVADGTHFSVVNAAIGRFACNLSNVYCTSNASIGVAENLTIDTLYGPIPDYLYAKHIAGITNKAYLYRGNYSTMTIANSFFSSSAVVNCNIYLQTGASFTNNSSHATIEDHITVGYSETFTPCIEIKVNGNTQSTTTYSTTIADLKAALNQRLEEEAAAAAQAAQVAADRAAALEVDNQIDNLPSTITLANKTAVQACRSAYNALTVSQKGYVTKLSVLQAAEQAIVSLEANQSQVNAYKAAANEVDSVILAIPSNVTLEDKPKVVAARNAYNALANDAKVYVTKYYKLETAEAEILRLEAERDERIAKAREDAGAVDTLINNLPLQLGLSDKNQVVAAREAYEELTGEAKGYVTKLAVLENAEREIRKLELAAGKTAEELAAIKAKAKEVDDLIAAFPVTIAMDVQEQVEAARAAYNALSEEEKLYVENLASLEKAEDDLRELGAKLAGDEKEDEENKLEESINNLKEKINSSKGLKALTICVSIVFGFGLIYVVYLIIRKAFKWLRR